MPSDAEQIAVIKRQTLALIATITADPKPTYSVDGQKVAWGEYLAQLQNTVAWCDSQTASITPTEARTQGYT